MHSTASSPWQPDPRWADPLIALLLTLTCLVAGLTLRARARMATRPSEQVSLQGRLLEVALMGPEVFLGRASAWERSLPQADPWDHALLTLLRREGIAGAPWQSPFPVPSGQGREALLRVIRAAYEGGPLPSAADRAEVHRRLGHGYGADLLEARLQDRQGDGTLLRTQARQRLAHRLILLGALGLAVLGLALGGLGMGVALLLWPRLPSSPWPTWGLSGRAATLIFLIWFLAFFAAGNLAGLLLWPWPSLRWVALPLGYLLHAALGLRLITWAEGLSVKELWLRVAPGKSGKDLAWGAGFLALAVSLVLVAAMVSGQVFHPEQHPQRELQELLQGLRGWPATLALFFTVAGLAPCFEELFFRGFLLPVLAREGRLKMALLGSALLFGAIHLQPAGLITLATLGWALGLAFRHTGSLRTPILVHACWNGTLFLLLRFF